MIISDRGLGSMFGLGALVPLPNYQDPGYPPDAAIVASNARLNAQYGLDLEKAQADNNFAQCVANAQNSNSPQQYADTIARCNGQYTIQTPDIHVATPSAPSYHNTPMLQFITSRAGSVLYPGDTWTIKISGGLPGSKVSNGGSMKGVTFSNPNVGVLDGNGGWAVSGTITAGDEGVWQEQWAVNNTFLGYVNFTVTVPKATSTVVQQTTTGATTSTTGTNTAAGSNNTAGTGPLVNSGAVEGDTSLLGLSTGEMLGLGAAGLAVMFMMFSGRR